MILFLFLFQVAFLSGVTACTTMAMMSEKTTSIAGYILLPFYVIVGPAYLFKIGDRIKESTFRLGFDGREKDARAQGLAGLGPLGLGSTFSSPIAYLDYKKKLEEIKRRSTQDIITDVKTGNHRKSQVLTTDSNGYKAAVITGLLGPFEQKFWWWKIFLMLERAALAILVYVGASSWYAMGLAGVCWLSSLLCQPYWSGAEDGLDIMVRLTTTLVCVAAGLYEGNGVAEDEL